LPFNFFLFPFALSSAAGMERIARSMERYMKPGGQKRPAEALCCAMAEKRFQTRTMSGQPVLACGIARPRNYLVFIGIIIKSRKEISKKTLV
jgi:hypothetical protein